MRLDVSVKKDGTMVIIFLDRNILVVDYLNVILFNV